MLGQKGKIVGDDSVILAAHLGVVGLVVLDDRDLDGRMGGNIRFFLTGKGLVHNIQLSGIFVFQIDQVIGIFDDDLGHGGVHLVFQSHIAFPERVIKGFRHELQNTPGRLGSGDIVSGRVNLGINLVPRQGCSHLVDGRVLYNLRGDPVGRAPAPEGRVIGVAGHNPHLHPGDLLDVAVFPAVVVRPYCQGGIRGSQGVVIEKVVFLPFRRLDHVGHDVVGPIVQASHKIGIGAGTDKGHLEARALGDVGQALDIRPPPDPLFILIRVD